MGSVGRVALVLALAVAPLLSGCVFNNKMMASWVGHHQSELVTAWGPPQSTSSDGKGGTILTYSTWVDMGPQTVEATTASSGVTTYTAPPRLGHQRTRVFYANERGIIYQWQWQGN